MRAFLIRVALQNVEFDSFQICVRLQLKNHLPVDHFAHLRLGRHAGLRRRRQELQLHQRNPLFRLGAG